MRFKTTSFLIIMALFVLVGCGIFPESNNSRETTTTVESTTIIYPTETLDSKLIGETPTIMPFYQPTATTDFMLRNQYDILWSAPKDCQLDQLSPNSTWVTYVCLGSGTKELNEIWLQRIDSTESPIFLSNDIHSVWSPNSDALITYFLDSIKLFTLSDLNHEKMLINMRLSDPPEWSPNGDMILVERADANSLLSVVHLDGTVQTILTESDFFVPPKMILEPTWLPDNRHIYWGWRSSWVAHQESVKQIWKIDIQSGDRELILETTEDISINNIEILSTNILQLGDYLFDTQSHQLIFDPLPFQAMSRDSYAWSPDGQFVAYWNERNGKELHLYTQEGNSTLLIELTDGSESRRILRWEEDGSGIWVIIDEFGNASGHEKLAFVPIDTQSIP